MRSPPDFPDDASGDALRRLCDSGDDLSQSRPIDFCFIFPHRRQAISFAEVLDETDKQVCISYYEGRAMWEVIVKVQMIPTHGSITALESALADKATLVGGEPDGWGCMSMRRNEG
jgi:hypothetical protein